MLELKIEDALLRIKLLAKETNDNYILSFSGGKDSTILAHLWMMAKERYNLREIPFLFVDTKLEYDANYEFIKWFKDNIHEVEQLEPGMSFLEVTKRYGKPFASKMKSQFISTYQNSEAYQYYYLKNLILDKPVVCDNQLIYPLVPLSEKEWLTKVIEHYEKINKWITKYNKQNGANTKLVTMPEYFPKIIGARELREATHKNKCLGELISGKYTKKVRDRYFSGIEFNNLTEMEKEWIKYPEYQEYTQDNDFKQSNINQYQGYRTGNMISGMVPKKVEDFTIILETSKQSKEKLANKHFQALHPDFPIKISSECCKKMKEKPFEDYYVEYGTEGYLTGMRPAAEGGARAMNYKSCTSVKTVKGRKLTHRMPMFDWTDQDCDDFIEKYSIKISKAYTLYKLKRTGCITCPFPIDVSRTLEILYKFEPNKYKWVMAVMGDVYRAHLIELPFDEEYMKLYRKEEQLYLKMRYQMLEMFRAGISHKHKKVQLKLF